jgi:hypothetical protein
MRFRLLTNPSTTRLPLELEWPWPAVVCLVRAEYFIISVALPLVGFGLLVPRVRTLEAVYELPILLTVAWFAVEFARERLLAGWVRRQVREVRKPRAQLIHALPKFADLPRERQAQQINSVLEMLGHLEMLGEELDTGLVESFLADLRTVRERLNKLFPNRPDVIAPHPAVA